MIKHAGVEKTGGLNNDELLNIMDVIRVGDINSDSFEQLSNKIRYAYTLEKNDVKLKVVVDEYNDGKKSLIIIAIEILLIITIKRR